MNPQVSVKQRHEYELPTSALAVAVTTDGRKLYAGCLDGVYEIDAESKQSRRIGAHESYVSGVALLDGDAVLISAGYDGELQWHDLAAGTVRRTVPAHDFWSWKLAVSPDRTRVASATGQYLAGGEKYEPAPEREPSVKVFDARTGELVHALPHVPPVQSVAFSGDGRHLAAGNLMGEVRVWDAATGAQAAAFTTPDFTSWGIVKSHCYLGGIFDLCFAPDGHVLLTGMGEMRDPMAGNGRQLWQRFAWSESPARKVAESEERGSGRGLMEALALHPAGHVFAMAGRVVSGDWNCAIYSLADGALLHSFKSLPRVTQAAFSADGTRLYLAGAHGQSDKPFGRVAEYDVTASA